MKNFSEWVKTASGTELLKYKTATEEEKRIISDELDRRLEKNVPVILDNIAGFFASLMNDEETEAK